MDEYQRIKVDIFVVSQYLYKTCIMIVSNFSFVRNQIDYFLNAYDHKFKIEN